MRRYGLWLLLAVLVIAAILVLVIPERGERAAGKPVSIAMVQLTEVDRGTVAGFIEGMQQFGYREGRDVIYLNPGPVGAIDRLEPAIVGLLEQEPDLILVSSTPATIAVKRLTEGRQVPVVFAPVNDPLDAGIVSDLKQPGGYITGIRLPTGDDLRLKWLTRLAPGARRIYLPYTPTDKSSLASLQVVASAAAQLELQLITRAIANPEEVGRYLAEDADKIDAIFLPRDSALEARIDDFVTFANQQQLPLCAPSATQVEAGALFSYGFVHAEIGRQAAHLADQILRGIPPGVLPVEMAENYLVINLDSAKRIGLALPDEVLLQAERLIFEERP